MLGKRKRTYLGDYRPTQFRKMGGAFTYRKKALRPKSKKYSAFQGPPSTKPELKWWAGNPTANLSTPLTMTYTTTGLVNCINQIPQGVQANNHVGNSCIIKSIEFKFEFNQANATPGISNALRTVLVWDFQPDTSIAAITDIFYQNTGPVTNTALMTNLDNKDRFLILWDDIRSYGAISAIGASPPVGFMEECGFKYFRKIRMESVFQAGNTVPNSGALLVCQLGNAATSPVGIITYRLRFTDA